MSDTPISNTPMSATPRTDEIPHNVAELAMHARKLERENRQLEVAIYDLKTENNQIRKDADELILLNQAITMLAGEKEESQ